MSIDETCLLCPFSLKKINGIEQIQFSDHNTMILKLIIPQGCEQENNLENRWKLSKAGLEKLSKTTQKILYHFLCNFCKICYFRRLRLDKISYDEVIYIRCMNVL